MLIDCFISIFLGYGLTSYRETFHSGKFKALNILFSNVLLDVTSKLCNCGQMLI